MNAISKTLFSLLVIIALTFTFSACGSDEPAGPTEPETPAEEELTASPEIIELVKNNVKKKVTYSDFCVHVKLEHSLPGALPGKKIEYKICHSDRYEDASFEIIPSHNPIYPQVTQDGSLVTVKVDYPIYYYFIFKSLAANTQAEKTRYQQLSAQCEQDYVSYKSLKNMPSLDADDQQLLASLTKNLQDYEKMATGLYTITIYVLVDGRKVNLGNHSL